MDLEQFIIGAEVTRHIHQVTLEKDGRRLEVLYSNGKVTAGSLTLKQGYHILTAEEKESIAPSVAMTIEGKVYY